MPVRSNLDWGIIKANKNITARNYWKDRLANYAPGIYFDNDRAPADTSAGINYEIYILTAAERTFKSLYGFAGSRESMYLAMLSTVAILTQKCSSTPDICVFTPLYPDNASVVTDHTIIPVRLTGFSEMTFPDLLTVLRATIKEDGRHSNYPVEKMFDIDKEELEKRFIIGMLVGEWQQASAFNGLSPQLIFSFGVSDVLTLSIKYNTNVFGSAYIMKIAELYFDLLYNLIGNPDRHIGDIDIISEEEKQRLIYGFNDTAGPYPKEKTLISLFEQQVQDMPEKTAVVYEHRKLTYKELNEQANRLAHHLRDRYAIGPDDLVAIMAERSEQMIIGLLGILKSGGAYLPIDPVYPKERISYILEDSGAKLLLLINEEQPEAAYKGAILCLNRIDGDNLIDPAPVNTSDDLCYMIYTSGSTGKPKGVMISHYNVLNFMTGLSRRIPPGKDDCMLAVTSISFDISFLELFWTLCHGVEVVIHPSDISLNGLDRYVSGEDLSIDFSLFFFSSYNNAEKDKYHLLLESVKYADLEGFKAVWTPERHFHEFGGLFPNPSVISSALAMITRQIELRSGSIVSPLHDVIRIAEEWSVVDNLSGGRVGLSFASGWNPNDFVLSGDAYKDRQRIMYEQITAVRELWRGGNIRRKNGLGQEVDLRIFPSPVQKELPVWVTSSGSEETFRAAGAMGVNLLTHLLGQDMEELSKKIRLYRESRIQHGHDGNAGKVAIMLHTYIGEDIEEVEKLVEQPFIEYLKNSIGLTKILLEETGLKEEDIAGERMEIILKNAFRRYYQTGSLIGTKSTCSAMVQKLKETGVDEIACLVDFGIEDGKVIEGLKNLRSLKELFFRHGARLHRPVTMLQSTPSFIKLAREGAGSEKLLKSLRLLLLGGEGVPASLVRRLQEDMNAVIWNMYGPTETTIWSCMHKFEDNPEKVSIGKPMLNTRIFILNKRLQVVPVGMAGELYIAGDGLARGYWKRLELTKERFIKNPFNKGENMYKTGDIARWRPDGNIELIGRSDQQVKIRGYRIELGEIESHLSAYEHIRESVVVAREKEGEKYLAGYYIPEGEIDVVALKNFLSARLPQYMVPSYLLPLAHIPMTPNGKIDRKALPDPEIQTGGNYVMPSDEIEKRLAKVWAAVLHLEENKVGIRDDFFIMGGHSITAVRLIYSIEQQFSVIISLKEVFEHATVEKQARLIKNNGAGRIGQISRAEKKEYYPASSAQERLFYEQMTNRDNLTNNNSSVYEIKGELDIDKLKRSFRLLIKRHEGLRTGFSLSGQDIVQKVYKEADFELSLSTGEEYRTVEDAFNGFIRPFDLSKSPLIRCGLWVSETHGRFLLVDIHHIVCDGISVNVLMNDFKNIYQGKELPPVNVTYVDYTRWQRAHKNSLQKERKFWAGQLSGKLPHIDLPVLRDRKSANIYLAGRKVLTLGGEQYRQIKKMTTELNTTDFMLLLSVYYILLSKMTGNTDIIIGTDAIGRTKAALSNIVGSFINVLPLRIRFSGHVSFEEFLSDVKNCVLESFDNQEYQFDHMSSLLGSGENEKIVEVYFSTADFLENEAQITDLEFVPFKIHRQAPTTRYELELNIEESNDRINVSFIYSTTLYDIRTIDLLMTYYYNILMAALHNRSMSIEQIQLLSDQ